MGEQAILEIKNIVKSFKNEGSPQVVLDHVSLKVQSRKIYCLLGYSGCGKTTLLRMISADRKSVV